MEVTLMFGSAFEIAKIVILVAVIIPMMIGFVLSVLGLATVQLSRISDRRLEKVVDPRPLQSKVGLPMMGHTREKTTQPQTPIMGRTAALSVADS